ncbi:MAG: NADH-quinone oxidoreductase subunit L [Candidatus Sumerlaeia bacterium]|nr:NADH-quinone oxidoreductase subunit L [Candidatus Sumerlaeia bacterium]
MLDHLWLIPVFPALAALICGVWGRRLQRRAGWVAIAAMLLSSALAASATAAFVGAPDRPPIRYVLFDWIQVGALQIPFSLLIDQLTVVMLVVVSFIGTLVFIYSTGYMKGDPGYARFFSFMSLFAAAMYLLVLADNFVVLFIGWEGVGLCSYLLIGYYMEKDWCADAGKKAFIVNRIGDLGFVLGIALIFAACGNLDISHVSQHAAERFEAAGWLITAATLLLFLGAIGKSAQIPLFVWLPDAMAGPTPVSALIHAATMVTAGVYMVARCNALFALAPVTMAVVGLIGAATALVAASIGLTQRDIKKVLAYSTVSQLGYMFMALGVGAFATGIFHLYTHAFFKGALFLCAGSVICALHHEQDMLHMGGLRKAMPVTWMTYLLATLAITGCPLTAGFFSKDEILWRAASAGSLLGWILWVIGLLSALMTAVYMFRSLYLTFHGPSRVEPEKRAHVRESPASMTLPLILLAAGSIMAGWIGLPQWLGGSRFEHFLEPVLRAGRESIAETAGHAFELAVTALSVAVFLAGWLVAHRFFLTGYPERAERAAQRFGFLYRLSANRWWWDDAYNAVIVRGFMHLTFCLGWLDQHVVDGLVNGTGRAAASLGDAFRWLQNGRVQFYAFAILRGVNVLILVLLYGHAGDLLAEVARFIEMGVILNR